jgi:hypothetical protein
MTATLPVTRCPDAPDGEHLPTVVEVEGDFQRVCLHCGARL